jgi:hypothetical protein
MKKTSEDEILKPLFDKIRMEEAPGDLTFNIMEQIMADPEFEPARKLYYEWWWPALGLLSMLSMYVTGVFTFLGNIFTPYFIEIQNLLAGYWTGLAELLPSNIVVLPTSYVLPVILPGILIMLLMDLVFSRNLRGISGW